MRAQPDFQNEAEGIARLPERFDYHKEPSRSPALRPLAWIGVLNLLLFARPAPAPGATGGLLTASPTSISFGNVALGGSSTQSCTVTNTGNSNVTITQGFVNGTEFKVSSTGGSFNGVLTPGQGITFNVIFAPTTMGSVTGSISIASNAANSPLTVPLSGTGVPPALGVSPGSINFGNVTVGNNSSQAVTLTNTGTGNLTVSQATVSGAGFSISGLSLPLTLTARQTITFSATFAPTTAGSASGTISITSNAANSPLIVPLSGTGVTLLLSATPSSLSFGNVTVGGSSSESVTLTNTGTGSVTISKATVTGAGFSLSGLSLPFTLTAGKATTFSATLAPATTGSASGNVAITSNATNSPATVSLSGTGVSLLISARPTSSDFGNVILGSSSTLPVILTNTGTGNVTISQATVTGTGFSISGLPLPLALPAGQNTSFSVTFAPPTAGSVTGNVSIVSNATNSPTIESLSGTGIHAVDLSWTASISTVAGYNVYRGTVSGGPYTKLNSSLVAGIAYTDTAVQGGQIYYYVTTAVDSSGNESTYSNQAQAVVPSP